MKHQSFSPIPDIRRRSIPASKHRPEQQLQAHEKNGVVWLEAPALSSECWLTHAFSTRLGGISSGETYSMNLSFAREPDQENVQENYRRLLGAVGINPQGIVLTHQTHSDHIRTVTAQDAGKGLLKDRDYTDVDGLITNVPGMTLAVFMSDCVPVLAADPVHHAVGAAHSGWRGTVSGIGTKLIQRMQEEYGSQSEDMICVIGPSICQVCYEVTGEVIERFREVYPEHLWTKLFYPTDEIHFQLNLWEACRQNFLAAGVSADQITVTDICTRCNPELLYSHRRQHGKQGNLAGLIGIR